MAQLLMPKATAVWLIENTALGFDQIADFCALHPLEIKAIADGEVNIGMVGLDPVFNGQVTREEIARCEKEPDAKLKLQTNDLPDVQTRSKGPRYTPVTKRSEKPDAIAWLLKAHPELSDAQIVRLIGTTKSTIDKIRTRSHWNMANIKPRDPVILGLCKQGDLNVTVEKARKHLPKTDELPEQPLEGGFNPFANANQNKGEDAPDGPISGFGGSSDDEQQPSDAGFDDMMRQKG